MKIELSFLAGLLLSASHMVVRMQIYGVEQALAAVLIVLVNIQVLSLPWRLRRCGNQLAENVGCEYSGAHSLVLS